MNTTDAPITETVSDIPQPPQSLADKVFVKYDSGRPSLCVIDSLKGNGHNGDSSHLRSYQSRLKRILGDIPVCFLDPEEFSKARQDSRSWDKAYDDVDTEKLVMDLLRQAVRLKASDIHIRVYVESHASISFRQQGDMTFFGKRNSDDADKLCTAMFASLADQQSETTFSGLKRMRARISDRKILPKEVASIRIESGPIAGGYHMVMRLLYTQTQEVSGSLNDRLTVLGYHPKHIADLIKAFSQPTGIIIFSGATNSGKSTTLKAVLESKHAELPESNFLTVEDPPEYPIDGAVQICAAESDAEKKGDEANYADAIKHTMRCDPDVIMIGEIRDGESGMGAIRAAMTGHQVLTTVHANRVYATLSRLRDLLSTNQKVDPDTYLCDPSIMSCLVYQALIKTLCPKCKVSISDVQDSLSSNLIDRLEKAGLSLQDNPEISFRGPNPDPNCPVCEGTGYSGRQVVAETCIIDKILLESFLKGGTAGFELEWRSRQPFDIQLHALDKIKRGLMDPRDVETRIGPLILEEIHLRRHGLFQQSCRRGNLRDQQKTSGILPQRRHRRFRAGMTFTPASRRPITRPGQNQTRPHRSPRRGNTDRPAHPGRNAK